LQGRAIYACRNRRANDKIIHPERPFNPSC
jgi:hypothetical protein